MHDGILAWRRCWRHCGRTRKVH